MSNSVLVSASNAFNQSVPAFGGALDLDDDEDLQGHPRTGWITAVDGNGTVLGFVPKEADKLGNLPITIEISEALVVRYTPPRTSCGYIQALNARLGYPYSKYPFPTNRPSYLSASWFSPVKENERPVFPNFASLSFATISHTNEMVASWTNCNGPTQHEMWRVYPDNTIQPYWRTGDEANPSLDFILRENSFIRLCLNPVDVDKPRAGWEVITLRFKPM